MDVMKAGYTNKTKRRHLEGQINFLLKLPRKMVMQRLNVLTNAALVLQEAGVCKGRTKNETRDKEGSVPGTPSVSLSYLWVYLTEIYRIPEKR